MGLRQSINDFFDSTVWGVELSELGVRKGLAVKTLRLIYHAMRDISEGQLTLRAMSLVYTTLLSLVPLLAVSFSVLKAFGVHNQIEPFLYNLMAPLGPKGEELTLRIITFVENIKVGVLGSLGLAMLIYTVISLIKKIELAINAIWKIKRPRSFARRFSDYMSVVLIGPVLVVSAIGLTASVTSATVVQQILAIEPFGTLFVMLGKFVPYVLIIAAFTFVYIFVPSVKVNFRSALVGGIFAGLLWESVGWAFASFIVSSTKYAAIYSGFAILILFMIWLYINWLILLLGASVSFYHQYPQFLNVRKEALLVSNRLRERLAYVIMFLVARNHHEGRKPWSLNALIDRLGLPIEPIQEVLETLELRGLVVESGDEPPGYLPAKDIDVIKMRDLRNQVRGGMDEGLAVEEKYLRLKEVDEALSTVSSSVDRALGDKTIKDLVLEAEKREAQGEKGEEAPEG